MEFSGYIGALGSFLVISIMIWILSFIMKPLGPAGKVVTIGLKIALGIWITYCFFNMLGTVSGLRGSCPQGYISGWPAFAPKLYKRDPVTGLRQDEATATLFN